MSETGSNPASEGPPRPSRLRRFVLRHLPLSLAGGAFLLVVALTAFFFWANSAQCERIVRRWLIAKVETMTGGRVEIASFHWHLFHLEADADGVTIHGLEAPGEAPYASIGNLRVRLSVLGFLSPKILLSDLDISHPSLHLIVYPDGSTNQPRPRKPAKPGKPVLDTLFDLRAGRISVEQGIVDYENRAASFDYQNRNAPLDLSAHDVALRLAYIPASAVKPESFRIEAGAVDLNLTRSVPHKEPQHVHGYLQATLDLTRTAAYLRSLRLTSESRGSPERTLEISGTLADFAHPSWQARMTGDLDMRLLEPVTGYTDAPQGIARLDLSGAGRDGIFRIDGNIHVDGGAYIGTGVTARGVRLDAHVHADPESLLITSIAAQLQQGGEIDGSVSLVHWLPPIPGAPVLRAGDPASAHAAKDPATSVRKATITIPVNGKVTAQLKDVALDTILDLVSKPPFQRLGFNAFLNGPATATWADGNAETLAVSAALTMSPSGHPAPGEVPASGVVDGAYTERNGTVALRSLEIHTPGSSLLVSGALGAYPITSASSLAVDFHSRNLGEFNTVLRSLGLKGNGTVGVAALPVTLRGEADFHGSWTGSLADPRIAGDLKATQLTVEMPAAEKSGSGSPQSAQHRYMQLDSAVVEGSYSAQHISINHAQLMRGQARILVQGTLDAAPGRKHAFNAGAVLHASLQAAKIGVDDLQPLFSRQLPFTGTLNAQFQADGPLGSPGGAGWVELDNGSVYGEHVARIRAQGSFAGQTLKLTSLTASKASGNITASGNYNVKSRRYQLQAKGAGLDVSQIDWLSRQGMTASGKMDFSLAGSGTLDNPQLDGLATFSALKLNSEMLGRMEVTAHAANHTADVGATTQVEGTAFNLRAETSLSGEYETRAQIEFSHFNIGALFKRANVQGLTGESSLDGTVNLSGPLARPKQFRGEARLQEMQVTVAGVHLKSEGGVHATLADERVRLDPLHVTGEDTDLRGQGTLELTGARRLDLAASGTVNMKLAETLDPDLTASGVTTFQIEAHGTLKNPGLQGRIDFQNCSIALEDLPNSLSQLHGTLVFNQNRLEVKTLTAMSGGGLLQVSGSLAYMHGIYADLTVTGNGIRIRYPQGVSSLANTKLRLQGSQRNLLLSGDILITRFMISPDLDIAALAAQTNGVEAVTPPNAPSNHIRLDVHITSAPQLNFQNAFAKLAGDVDLRLVGTVASPSLLGRVSVTEGSAMIAGTRYELQRGEISFTNPVRIEPTIDLNATAHVEDYDVTLSVHGTPAKLSVSYRSDPPLPEADVVSLLALGRTQNEQSLYTQQQHQAFANPSTDALLGGALSATVSSRVQKLFGAGSVKIDPNYLGAFGNTTSRIIVNEQLGRNLTLTYATNVNTTGQQLLQADYAINRHVSLLVTRDEAGVFSIVIKAIRRYR